MPDEGQWTCRDCRSDNAGSDDTCDYCGSQRSAELLASLQPRNPASTGGEQPGAEEAEDHDEERRGAERVEKWGAERRRRLLAELREIDTCAPNEQRSRLRALQLELHPDKQSAATRSQATPLFLLVQKEWEAFEAKQRLAAADAQHRKQQEAPAAPERRRAEEAASGAPGVGPFDFSSWQEKLRRQTASTSEARKRRDDEEELTAGKLEAAAAAFHRKRAQRRKEELAARHLRQVGQGSSSRVELKVTDMYVVHSIAADSGWMVWEVKEALEASSRVPREQQRLLLGSMELQDGQALRSLQMGRQLRLILVVAREEYCDFEYVARAVRHDGAALQYACTELRGEPGIVRQALRHGPRALLEHAAPELQRDPELFQLVVEWDGMLLAKAAKELQGHLGVVSAAVQQTWRALQHASQEMQANPCVLMLALQQDVAALQFAPLELRENADFIRAAVTLRGAALQFASPELRRDVGLVVQAMKQDRMAVKFAAPGLRDNPAVLAALKGQEYELRHLLDRHARNDAEKDLFSQNWGWVKRWGA